MGKSVFSLLLLGLLALPARSQYWQQQVDTKISVSLNDKEHTLDGFETLVYSNNSPDTLHFIWFHCWPNAFKNDQTAFSDQLLVNNRTDFYFSKKEQRGYINHLDFKVDGITAATEDHPQYIDVVRLILPKPLAPGARLTISTPFHVQLPENFSRGGHQGQSYQVTQWFPKPAVYDSRGWHPMPYLDQGEFYSEFGDYDVSITLPANYVVAATGELQNADEKLWLNARAGFDWKPITTKTRVKKGSYTRTQTTLQLYPPSDAHNKTLHFLQQNALDFAWFADKRFIVNQDTIMLAAGKTVYAYSYYLPGANSPWKNSIHYIKNAIHFRSRLIGEYPYPVVSAVEAKMGFSGGMEYPTITSISTGMDHGSLEKAIEHEVGHNWLQGILATNEREHPWMDEGMNSYYDERYDSEKKEPDKTGFFEQRLPSNEGDLLLQSLEAVKKDQPIETPAADFTELNNNAIAYSKTAAWMQVLEKQLGQVLFDSCMKAYYRKWQFRHPYPDDFKAIVESTAGRPLNDIFALQARTGPLPPLEKRAVKPVAFFSLANTEKYRYINLLPAIGYNLYDKFMVGAMVHNYGYPTERFRFLAIPLYATGSKRFNYLARASYSWFPSGIIYKAELGLAASSFAMDDFQPDSQPRIVQGFWKTAPFVRLTFKEKDPHSRLLKYVQFKPFFFREENLNFHTFINGIDTMEVVDKSATNRYLNQLKLGIENSRALYPYSAELQVEQGAGFVRAALTGNYYFNYGNNKSGLGARIFAGKFFYTGEKTTSKAFELDRYQLNLSGPNGYEDYTYSNYFLGRNEFEGTGSKQMMIRDGGFKVGTPLLSSKIGKTDNWLCAINLVSDLFNRKFPLRVFADIGTSATAWETNSTTSRVLFDAGLQLSLLKETLNIYFPLLYSSVYKDYYKSTLGENYFFKTIVFSIDIQQFRMNKLTKFLDF